VLGPRIPRAYNGLITARPVPLSECKLAHSGSYEDSDGHTELYQKCDFSGSKMNSRDDNEVPLTGQEPLIVRLSFQGFFASCVACEVNRVSKIHLAGFTKA
jgi:hypothetical protein